MLAMGMKGDLAQGTMLSMGTDTLLRINVVHHNFTKLTLSSKVCYSRLFAWFWKSLSKILDINWNGYMRCQVKVWVGMPAWNSMK